MCLSVPAKVLEIDRSSRTAKVDYMGSQMMIGISLLEEVKLGQYVLVHVGEAIEVIDEGLAIESITIWREWLDQT